MHPPHNNSMNHLFFRFFMFIVAFGLFVGCKSKVGSVQNTPNFLGDSTTVKSKARNRDVEEEDDDYYDETRIRYENYVYVDSVTSVLMHLDGWPLSMPIIRLNEEGQLRLSFDDLRSVTTNLSYTFIHCNANWEPSGMDLGQVIRGLPYDFITDFQYSRNTFQQYVHYNVVFPNENLDFRISGNYIIKVYNSDNEDEVFLTWRFMVAENQVFVAPTVQRGTMVKDRNTRQEVDFTLRFKDSYEVTNPYTHVHVALLQNQRWDNAITNLKPTFVKDHELVYDYNDVNVFNGGNEFRFFDIKDMQFRTQTVKRLVNIPPENQAYLVTDKRRAFKVYLENPDINGQRLISRGKGWNADIDADYVKVHFALEYPDVAIDGDIYIFGALTNWTFDPAARLVWDYEENIYKNTMFLKQGYYNYSYIFVGDGDSAGDETVVEGSHFQTENDYLVLVYHRPNDVYYDRLIATQSFSFPPNR